MAFLYQIDFERIYEPLLLFFNTIDDNKCFFDVSALCLPDSLKLQEKADFIYFNSDFRADLFSHSITPFDKAKFKSRGQWRNNTYPKSIDGAIACFDVGLISEEDEDDNCNGFVELNLSKLRHDIQYVKFVLSNDSRCEDFFMVKQVNVKLVSKQNNITLFEHSINFQNFKYIDCKAGSFLSLKRENNTFALHSEEICVKGDLFDYIQLFC